MSTDKFALKKTLKNVSRTRARIFKNQRTRTIFIFLPCLTKDQPTLPSLIVGVQIPNFRFFITHFNLLAPQLIEIMETSNPFKLLSSLPQITKLGGSKITLPYSKVLQLSFWKQAGFKRLLHLKSQEYVFLARLIAI